MSTKEINQIQIFTDLETKKIKQAGAAKMLHLSIRQVKRKLKAFRRSGATSLVHGNRGKASNHSFEPAIKMEAISIVSNEYPDFGPTFAAEKLLENHQIDMNHETLRLLMTDAGLWKPKYKKMPDIHVWRERMAYFGELIQADGSPHDWFEGRAPKCTLIAYIDDATSRTVWLEFAASESTESLMRTTRSYLEIHGKPVSLYTDRGGVYKVNLNNEDKDKLTQYGRALEEIGINHIHARSPQAKGRVERLFGTLQDRLVKELRLKGISTIEEANRFIREEYLTKHNEKFSVKAREEADLHSSVSAYNLDNIFCLKSERQVNNDSTISYKTRWFQLKGKQPTIVRPKTTVEIWESLDGIVSLHVRGLCLNSVELTQKPKRIVLLKERREHMPNIPSANHPWRQYQTTLKSDISILQKGDISILL